MTETDRLLKEALETSGCPTPEEIFLALDRKDALFEQHLETCPRCQSEVELLRDFERGEVAPDEKEDLRWVVERMQLPPSENQVEPDGRVSRRLGGWLDNLGWKPMAALATLALLAALILNWPSPTSVPGITPSQTLRSDRVNLVEPIGLQQKPPTTWRWEPVENAVRYRVRVFEVDGTEVWSGVTVEPGIIVSTDVSSLLLPGKRLRWQVRAERSDGSRLALSDVAEFWLPVPEPAEGRERQ